MSGIVGKFRSMACAAVLLCAAGAVSAMAEDSLPLHTDDGNVGFWQDHGEPMPLDLALSKGFLVKDAENMQPGFSVQSGPDLMRTVLGVSPAATRLEASGLLASMPGLLDNPDLTTDPFARLKALGANNFGATVGYRGFHLSGSYLDLSALNFNTAPDDDALRAWQAGFGYRTGSLGLALSYETTDSGLAGISMLPVDEKRWSFGGTYSITPAVQVDANAFYISRDELETKSAPLTPEESDGPGAHVGIKLNF